MSGVFENTSKRREAERVPLLKLDPALATGMDPKQRANVEAEIEVIALWLPPGPWRAPRERAQTGDLGILVLEGLLVREVVLEGSSAIELLGEGDLLRPWQEDAASFCSSRWRILKPTRIALLDRRVVASIASHPALLVAVIERTMRRARWLAAEAAVSNLVGVEKRVLTLFWQLAERWGRLEDGRAVLPMKLTHAMIADMVGSRRPSVTQALTSLTRRGEIGRFGADGCWSLLGTPPVPTGRSQSTTASPQSVGSRPSIRRSAN